MTPKDYGTSVQLLAYTCLGPEARVDVPCPDGYGEAEALIEYAGRKCYANEDKLGDNLTWIQARIVDGHTSILEHSSATFLIVASRVLTHELVRHRIASYSQRSQRYVNESKPRYVTPPVMAGVSLGVEALSDFVLEEFNLRFLRHMEVCWDLYAWYVAKGCPREEARYVLPNACETQIVTTMNFRELRHFISIRAHKKAAGEMREVAGKVKAICRENWPMVFRDL